MTNSFPECISGVRGLIRLFPCSVPWFVSWAKARLAGEPTPKKVPLQRGNPRALEQERLPAGVVPAHQHPHNNGVEPRRDLCRPAAERQNGDRAAPQQTRPPRYK